MNGGCIVDSLPSPAAISEFFRLYGRLFEKSADGVIVGTPAGEVLRANEPACRMLGFSEAEIQARGRALLALDGADLREFLAAREKTPRWPIRRLQES